MLHFSLIASCAVLSFLTYRNKVSLIPSFIPIRSRYFPDTANLMHFLREIKFHIPEKEVVKLCKICSLSWHWTFIIWSSRLCYVLEKYTACSHFSPENGGSVIPKHFHPWTDFLLSYCSDDNIKLVMLLFCWFYWYLNLFLELWEVWHMKGNFITDKCLHFSLFGLQYYNDVLLHVCSLLSSASYPSDITSLCILMCDIMCSHHPKILRIILERKSFP